MLSEEIESKQRISTNITEFDNLLGGGLVQGSVLLIGGDPGVGKSTLILQILNNLSKNQVKTLYISGEESKEQIKNRAKRLNINENIALSNIVEVGSIAKYLNENQDFQFVVIDSIQTTYLKEVSSFPGSVNQLRNSTLEFADIAKQKNIIFILIGHITKDGQIAGPKLLEHMVDTVLYFEGDKNSNIRFLRSYKNRYGNTNEIALFDMTAQGLKSIENPSEIFLENHNEDVSGSSIFPMRMGSQTIILELQALVAKSQMANPKRAVVGWDNNRLSIILAVLNSKANLDLSSLEVYFNVIGGIKVLEPAADLAASASIISAALNIPLPKKTVMIGEVGLSGEVRSVTDIDKRLEQVEKLGYQKAIIAKSKKKIKSNLEIVTISHINELYRIIKQ